MEKERKTKRKEAIREQKKQYSKNWYQNKQMEKYKQKKIKDW